MTKNIIVQQLHRATRTEIILSAFLGSIQAPVSSFMRYLSMWPPGLFLNCLLVYILRVDQQ